MTRIELTVIKKLALSVLVFFAIFLAIDYAAGTGVTSYFNAKKLNSSSSLEYARYINAEVLVFGASQAEAGYNSSIITKLTSLRTANLAMSLSNSTYSYILLKEYLRTNKPKYIIYEFTFADLMDSDKILETTCLLRHLYGKNKEIDSVFCDIKPNNRLSLFFRMFRDNRLIFDILKNHPVTTATDMFRPGIPDNGKTVDAILNKQVDNPLEFLDKKNDRHNLDRNSVSYKYFMKILKLCHENNIKILLINSPRYVTESTKQVYNPVPDFVKTIKPDSIWSYYNISSTAYPLFKDKKYFKDLVHVNALGADSLSIIVSKILLQNSHEKSPILNSN